MTEFTDEQHERAQSLLQSYKKRAKKHKELQSRGKVPEKKLPTLYSSLGSKYENVGILSVYVQQIADAQEYFALAADNYLSSAHERRDNNSQTLDLTKALYTAMLAGDTDHWELVAKMINESHRQCRPETDAPNADRFYLAHCLASAILNTIVDDDLDHLEEINQSKPEVHALYGLAILEFTSGIRDDDPSQIERGIESMLEYHSLELDEENVVDRVMSLQATALLIIAIEKGYNIKIDSEFIPNELVDASVLWI